MELSKEQQLIKLQLEGRLKEDYDQIIPRFFNKQIHGLQEDLMVTTTAYGVNREQIFYDCLSGHLDKRNAALGRLVDPRQGDMFSKENLQ